MKPAYHIPLKATTLQLIGEICAIQGQVEWMMQNTVRELLKIDNETVQRIMGSTSIATNAEIWIRLIRKKESRKSVLRHAEQALSDIRELAEGRNDFVHAVYMRKGQIGTHSYFVYYGDIADEGGVRNTDRLAVAMRVRNRKIVPVDKLREIRDVAASISIRMAHVFWMMVDSRRHPEPSPLLGRLTELPPLDPPKREPQPAKARPSPPRSSRTKSR